MQREYNEKLDGALEQAHPAEFNIWQAKNSNLFFFEDECQQLSLSYDTFNETQAALNLYAESL